MPLKRQEAPCGYVVHYGQVYDSTFAHNTFVNISGADITIGINYKSSWPQQQMLMIPESNLFVNNLIYKPSGGTAIVTQRPDTSAPFNKLSFKPNQFEGNLVYGGTLAISAPSSDASGFIFADPRVSRRDGMFRPAPDSPAIDGGSERVVTNDIEGQRRNRQPDIGADEVSRGPVRHRPLTAQDVGPEWMK